MQQRANTPDPCRSLEKRRIPVHVLLPRQLGDEKVRSFFDICGAREGIGGERLHDGKEVLTAMLHFAHQHVQLFPGGLKLRRSFGDPIFEFLLEHLQFLALGNQIEKPWPLPEKWVPKRERSRSRPHLYRNHPVGPIRTAQMPKQK
jgi:hypothetical protein